MTTKNPVRGRRRAALLGFTALELTIAVLIVSSALVSLTEAFMTSAQVVQSAQGCSRGTVFLQSVMEELASQPYDALPSFNGNRIFDHDTQQASNWSVDLAVFQAGVDLEQLDATLVDLRTARVITQLSTLRSRR